MALTLKDWMKAEAPNYKTNKDNEYAYSEVPYLGVYYLVKLPNASSNLIYHIDYWGEGRIKTDNGCTGFTDSYNVNHPFKVVSHGPDRGRKIPNRIPVKSLTNCDTSKYVEDDSVILLTVTGGTINTSCTADISRMVNKVVGKVIVFGFDNKSSEIANLEEELKYKALFCCPGYTVPFEMLGVTRCDKHLAFLNVTVLKNEIIAFIEKETYENAVNATKNLNNEYSGEVIKNIVRKLFDIKSKNIMAYAYKLWIGGAQDVICKCFPAAFNAIFNEAHVTIVNRDYLQALKLDDEINERGVRRGWAINVDKTSTKMTWQFTVPDWSKDKVVFKIYNKESDMYLTFDNKTNTMGDREVWGKKVSAEDADMYYLEPAMCNGNVVFYIINSLYGQCLKVPYVTMTSGNRCLWGHNKRTEWRQRVYRYQPRFRWVISASSD